MPKIRPTESNLEAIAKFQHDLKKLQESSDHDLIALDMTYTLGNLGPIARQVDEKVKREIKLQLKRILLSNTPSSLNYRYINEHLSDLAYTQQELAVLRSVESHSQQQAEIIAGEVRHGKDPWLASIEHNERNLLNPYVIGFYQDPDGKIRTIYGPRHFKSKRQIESSWMAGRTEDKEVNLISGEFSPVHPAHILKGEFWSSLPSDLRQHFEKGEILTTGNQDLNVLDKDEVQLLTDSTDPKVLLEIVDNKMERSAEAGNKYHLLYYSDGGFGQAGRVGVVMKAGADGIKPIIVKIKGKEFVIEVKGCGTKTGGFGEMQFRTGRDIITGGAEASQAATELSRLGDDTREGAPKSAGAIVFTHPSPRYNDYQQGYIIRFSPSTVRASYTEASVYPDIESPEIVDRIIIMQATQLAEHIFSHPHKILEQSSHSENMLLWGNGEFAWTDYSDQVIFADNNYPHKENQGGYRTPLKMLEQYIFMIEEIPGYQAKRDKPKFYTALMTAFRTWGYHLSLETSDDYGAAVRKIWESGMAYQVFQAKKANHYFSQSIAVEVQREMSSRYNRLFMDNVSSFMSAISESRQSFLKGIDLVEKKMKNNLNPEEVNKVRAEATGPFSQLVNNTWEDFRSFFDEKLDEFSSEEQNILFNADRYLSRLYYAIIEKFRLYFEYELDLISTARSSASGNEGHELERAEAELRTRMQRFSQLLDSDLEGFYKLITDPDQINKFVSFRFYGHS